jgi:tetratricopeptide (TPR) repeat protein
MIRNWLKSLSLRYRIAKQNLRAGDFARDSKDWPAAVTAYKAYLDIFPDQWPIRVQLGHAYKETGHLAAAERAYRKAVLAAPNDADAVLQLGHILKLTGRLDEAHDAYLRSMALDPDGPVASELAMLNQTIHRDKGDAARDSRQWSVAANHYATHLKNQPNDSMIWVQLGNMLKEAGALKIAERTYRRALELDASIADASVQLENLLRTIERQDVIRSRYQSTSVLDPADESRFERMVLDLIPSPGSERQSVAPEVVWRTLLDAQAARDEHKWGMAAGLFKEYLVTQPNAQDVWCELALMLRYIGHYDEAETALARADAIERDTIPVLRERALLLRSRGKIAASTTLFMQIMQRTGSADLFDEAGHRIVLSA